MKVFSLRTLGWSGCWNGFWSFAGSCTLAYFAIANHPSLSASSVLAAAVLGLIIGFLLAKPILYLALLAAGYLCWQVWSSELANHQPRPSRPDAPVVSADVQSLVELFSGSFPCHRDEEAINRPVPR